MSQTVFALLEEEKKKKKRNNLFRTPVPSQSNIVSDMQSNVSVVKLKG